MIKIISVKLFPNIPSTLHKCFSPSEPPLVPLPHNNCHPELLLRYDSLDI